MDNNCCRYSGISRYRNSNVSNNPSKGCNRYRKVYSQHDNRGSDKRQHDNHGSDKHHQYDNRGSDKRYQYDNHTSDKRYQHDNHSSDKRPPRIFKEALVCYNLYSIYY